jgi:coenzyme PQQ synthesis protein D (PqqD)
MDMIVRNPRIAARALSDGGGVLLHLDTSAYHGLNKTGWKIWTLIESGSTLDSLVERLGTEIGRPVPTLRDDTQRFVDSLVARGLILVERDLKTDHVATSAV